MKRISIIIFVSVTLLVFILELTGNRRVDVKKEQVETEVDSIIVRNHEENAYAAEHSQRYIQR